MLRVLTEELGYFVDWRVIDAKSFVPQHRERTFIVGLRDGRDIGLSRIDIAPSDKGPKLKEILHAAVDGTDFPYSIGGLVPDKYTLTDHLWSYLQGYAEKHRKAGNGFGFGLFGPEDVARTLSARYFKDGSEILIKQVRRNPRRLTPRECARLMGFEVRGGKHFKIPVSDTQAYRQFGNAVVVPVVKSVARHVRSLLETNAETKLRSYG
jgi:DNA (cytosine-5)-methyltransferase 1